MKLQAPYSGNYVDAGGELAQHLISKGFKQVDEQPKKSTATTRKRATKSKEQ
jgi:hypothetical protein